MDEKEKLDENLKDDTEQRDGFDSLTLDLYRILKRTNRTLWILVFSLAAIILIQGLYHTYKWSKYETVVVDSKDGGNANYVGNNGDVTNYGESGSPQEKADETREESKQGEGK